MRRNCLLFLSKVVYVLITALLVSLSLGGGTHEILADTIEGNGSIKEQRLEKEVIEGRKNEIVENFDDSECISTEESLVGDAENAVIEDVTNADARGGECSDSVYWETDENGVLRIFGDGVIPNMEDDTAWRHDDFYSSVKELVIEDGITIIGENAFSGFSNLSKVTIPESTSVVGRKAFKECIKIKEVVYDGDILAWIQIDVDDENEYLMLADLRCKQKADIKDVEIELSEDSFVFSGKPIEPVPTLFFEDINFYLDPATDYVIEYKDNVNAGTAKVIVSGKNNFKGEAESSFSIVRKPLTEQNVSLEALNFTYTGSDICPNIEVAVDGTSLQAGKDYQCSYKDNVNAGTATVSVSGVGNYKGTIKKNFTIVARKLVAANVLLSKTKYVYSGNPKKPVPKLVVNGKELVKGKDFTYSYKNNINAGKSSIIIKGKGNYQFSVTKQFIIVPKSVTPIVELATKNYTYNGKVRKPTVTVRIGEIYLSKSDYSVTYASGRKNVGKYFVKVELTKNYKGSKVAYFSINPKPTKIQKVVGARDSFLISWTKQSVQVTGYQIQYSTDSSFKKNVKSVKVADSKTNKKKIKKPKSGATYHVRVRTYKMVGNDVFFSSWSKATTTDVKVILAKKESVTLSSGSSIIRTFETTNTLIFAIPMQVQDKGFADKGNVRIVLKNQAGDILQNDRISYKNFQGEKYDDWFYADPLFIEPGTYTYYIENKTNSSLKISYAIHGFSKLADNITVFGNVSAPSGSYVKVMSNVGDGLMIVKTVNCSSKAVNGYWIEYNNDVYVWADKMGEADIEFIMKSGETRKVHISVTSGPPDFRAYLTGYYTRDNYFVVKITNNRPSNLVILRNAAHVENVNYKEYDRTIIPSSSVVIEPGKTKEVKFYVNGEYTYPAYKDFTLFAQFQFEGKTYDWHVWSSDSVYSSNGKWYKTYWAK